MITQYEVLRGVLAKGATGQHRAFERFCGSSEVLAITPPIIEQAAEIYTNLYRRGLLIGDADILIAATALSHRYVLATNNGFHFGRIAELQIDNWLENNQHRMHYDRYRKDGLQIGSGTIEIGCKHVIAARLKQAGMIWSPEGARFVAKLRTRLKSRRWDETLALRPAPHRTYVHKAA